MTLAFSSFGFSLDGLLVTLLWAAIAVLNFWIWKQAKAKGNLLMMIGGGWMCLASFLALFKVVLLGWQNAGWVELIGVGCLAAGFYLSVKPMVAANIAHLQAKVKTTLHDTMGKKGGGTPPASGGSS
jgi:hypothetical protein